MPLAHDPAANVAYLRLQAPQGDVETVELAPGVLADVDEAGRVCGLELLDANAQPAPKPS